MGAQTGVKFSMLDAMAMGLPVLHVHDEANAGQVTEGINGYILHYGKELASIYPLIPKQQRDGPGQASGSTVNPVKGLGHITLAKRIADIYWQCMTSRLTAEMGTEKEVI